jgi:hypothetical protein
MKEFQFKVLNNLLPSNLYLFRIGKSETNKCTECSALDDMMHYIFNCPSSLGIWKQLSRWWHGLSGQEITISEKDVILGLTPRRGKIIMEEQLNLIIMTVKWKIHTNKQMGEGTGWHHIRISIKNMIKTLSFIAHKNHKSEQHSRTWGKIAESLI